MSIYTDLPSGRKDTRTATGEAGVFLSLTGRLVYPEDDRVLRFLREGWFEHRELATVSRLLRPGDCFVDVGAHCGLYSKLAARRMKSIGTIVVVEPNPALHPFIMKNVDIEYVVTDGAVKPGGSGLVSAAISTGSGSAVLHAEGAGWSAYSTLQPVEGEHDARAIPVVTRSLESLIPAPVKDQQVIVKLDTEGLEYDILRQAASALRGRDDIHLMIEFDENNLERSGHSTAALGDLVTGFGYLLAELNPETFRLEPFDGGSLLWGASLVATRNLDLLNLRLATAEEAVVIKTEDFLRSGEAAARLYRDSEDLDKVLARLADQCQVVADIRTGLAGERKATVPAASSDEGTGGKTARALGLLDQISDEVGGLAGAARWFSDELTERKRKLDDYEQLHVRMNETLSTQLTTEKGMCNRLYTQISEALPAVQASRLNLAKLIALTAKQPEARSRPSTGDTFLPDALALEQKIKESLATAAWLLSIGKRQPVTAAVDAHMQADESTVLSELNHAQTLNRSLSAEVHRLGILVRSARQSRWLRLGERLGADVVRQLDMAGALISDMEKQSGSPEEAAQGA